MATNRGERWQSRLRGAQRHEVGDVDFGISLPAVPEPQPESPRRQASPETQSKAKSTQKRSAPAGTPSTNANISAKRQRINGPQRASPRLSRVTRDGSPRQAIPSSPGEKEPSGLDITGDSTVPEVPDLSIHDESLQMVSAPRSTRRNVASVELGQEVRESLPREGPGTGNRESVDLGEALTAGNRLQQVLETSTPTVVPQARAGTSKSKSKSAKARKQTVPSVAPMQTPRVNKKASEVEALDELSPNVSSGIIITPKGKARQAEFSDNEDVEAEEIDDAQAARFLQQRRPKPAQRGGNNRSIPVPADSHAEPKQRKKAKAKASPAVQRQGKNTKKSKKLSGSSNSREEIPVTVHRFTKARLVVEDEDDADILAATKEEYAKYSKRIGVNAVDVLAQICEEVVTSGLETLEEGEANAEDAAARREYRTKMRAVEAFQEELRIRLVELTIALDNNHTLSKRLRAKQKEKIDLRQELLQLRAKRENIALRMDEVRIKHEDGSKEAQDQAKLNTSLHDIELAVSRARENAPLSADDAKSTPSLSTLLASVADSVSNKSTEGGMLHQIKDFNAFLERAALALEGK